MMIVEGGWTGSIDLDDTTKDHIVKIAHLRNEKEMEQFLRSFEFCIRHFRIDKSVVATFTEDRPRDRHRAIQRRLTEIRKAITELVQLYDKLENDHNDDASAYEVHLLFNLGLTYKAEQDFNEIRERQHCELDAIELALTEFNDLPSRRKTKSAEHGLTESLSWIWERFSRLPLTYTRQDGPFFVFLEAVGKMVVSDYNADSELEWLRKFKNGLDKK